MEKYLKKLFSNFKCHSINLLLHQSICCCNFYYVSDWLLNIYLCTLCEKSINHRSSIQCNLCQTISHLKCNYLNYVDGLSLMSLNISWYYRACWTEIFKFTNIKKNYLSIKNTLNWSKREIYCIKSPEKLFFHKLMLLCWFLK